VNFAADSSSIIDAADEYIRVWSPDVLAKKTIDEEGSAIEEATGLSVVEGRYEAIRDSSISALCTHPNDHAIFVGREDGKVAQHDGETGEYGGDIYSHPNRARITALAVSGANVLASGDIFGNMRIWRLSSSWSGRKGPAQQEKELLLRARYSKYVRQIVFAPGDEYILASTAGKDELFLVKGRCSVRSIISIDVSTEDRKPWRWFVNPASTPDEPQFYLVEERMLRLFNVKTFGSDHGSIAAVLDYEVPSDTEEIGIVYAAIYPASRILVLDTRRRCRSTTLSCLFLFDLEPLAGAQSPPPNLKPLAETDLLNDQVRQMVTVPTGGQLQQQPPDRLFFLSQDSWLSSVDLLTMRPGSTATAVPYNRHFYVPTDFVTQEGDEVLPARTVGDDMVFSVHGEIAIIKNGLKFQEAQTL
jgi:hypothetical protein